MPSDTVRRPGAAWRLGTTTVRQAPQPPAERGASQPPAEGGGPQRPARGGAGPSALGSAEAGLGVLIGLWQRSVEELGSMTPPAQLRALLLIDAAGQLNLIRLARELGVSPSAASKLCSRLEAAGLVAREAAALSRREISLAPSKSGRQLAAWVRGQRGATIARALTRMSPEGRRDLARGLADLAAR